MVLMHVSVRRRRIPGVLAIVSLLITAAGVAFTPAPPAAATETSTVPMANLGEFRPGNIVSDAVFFNSSTMTERQIQEFLEARVPTCQGGYTCLRDWYDTSRSTSADAMCGAYNGGWRERASAIILKVAQACGINPQVILVTLQKEQGLVTHTWPSTWRYTIAMGQGCPDTAACDTTYYGFFNQVFGAAWQMKRYANPPGTSQFFTWYAPGRTWNILYNPNRGCGSGPVYIENQATANLYYYTPYQPNRAALNAGYGEGDGCSSYGNRNFFNYFTDWFGSTIGFSTSGNIAAAWNAQGGGSGWLGQPTAGMVYSGAAGGGWYQYFQNGIIYVIQSGPTVILRTGSALAQLYMRTGGPSGWLGWPTADEVCGAFGCAVYFQNGTSAWSNLTGNIEQLNGGIDTAWRQAGGVNNPVGVPAGSMTALQGDRPGWYQKFDYAYMFLAAGGTPQSMKVASGITQRYMALGGPRSAVGWPVSAESCAGKSCAVEFDRAVSVWTERVGVVDLVAPIADVWKREFGLGSWLGGPLASVRSHNAGAGGVSQRFQNGVLYAPADGPATALRADSGITQRYESAGGPDGRYGWATASERCDRSWCVTEFEGATTIWDATVGIRDVTGAMREAYRLAGGPAGSLGTPTSSTLTLSSETGLSQDFRGGFGYLRDGESLVVLRRDSGLAQQYRDAYHGPDGEFGWPRSAEICGERECRIDFERGWLAWNRSSGAITRG